MAAVFPLDTSAPWTFNGVTYEYDAAEDRWFVISTNKTDLVDESLETLTRGLDVTNTVIDQEIENRSNLLDAAATKNNQQDSSIIGLEARVDALASSVGSLQFKGRYTYVLESSEDACNAALAAALAGGMDNAEALRIHGECVAAVGQPYDAGSFTSKGATNVIDEIEEFLITTNDLDGHTIDWLNVTEEGDYLEFFDTVDGDTALYEVVDEPTIFNTEQTIRVKFISKAGEGDGKFNLQSEYEVRVFKAAQGIDLEEASTRFVSKPYVVYFEDTPGDITPVHSSGELKNGELWFDTSSLEMFVWNNNAWVAASPPPSQDIVVQSVVADVDALQTQAHETVVRVNSLISDLMLEPNIYYSDTTPTGDITGTLRNGDLWIDGTNLEVKFYSGGAWINPDRQVGGSYLETTGGTMTGALILSGDPQEGSHAVNRSYLTQNFLKDGFTSREQLIFRTGGTSKYPFKITNDVGGATLFKFDVSGGSNSPVRYIVDNECTHNFVGKVNIERLDNERQGFMIEGRKSDGTIGELLHVYHNSGTVADAVNYAGKITSPNNIVNKQYLDDRIAELEARITALGG